MDRPSRTIVLFQSDTHGGHRLGLLSPATVLWEEDEEGHLYQKTASLTKFQRWLWDLYIDDTVKVAALVGESDVVLIDCGDATHGKKYPQELVSTRMANQILIAVANVDERVAMLNPRSVRFIEGTSSHEFEEGSTPTLLVEFVRRRYPDLNVGLVRHGRGIVDGATIDYAHHGPSPGIRYWTSGNVARLYLRSLMEGDLAAGKRPPDLVVRGHFHTFLPPITERMYRNGEMIESTILLLPSYCGLSGHSRKVTRSVSRITVGCVAVEIVGGKPVGFHPLIKIIDTRKEERF